MKNILDPKITDALEAAQQEAAIHDAYLFELLKKHGLEPERNKSAVVSANDARAYLEELGYQVERCAIRLKDGAIGYEHRLYKLVDTSPKYQIKRVMSVEEE